MQDAFLQLFGAWLLPDPQTIWLVAYWAILAGFAWLEAIAPAFGSAPLRDRRWPTNIGFGVVNALLLPLAPVTAVIGAQWAQENGWGLLNVLEAPWWVAVVATFAIRSLGGYAFHVAMHKVHLFWRMHRVHHSDVHLDVTTTTRSHPFEFVAALLTMAPLAVIGGLDPLALVAYEIVEGATSLAAHANLRLPERVDRPLRWVFVTPNMHSLHHSSFQPETDSNYGQVFSFWDRMFGTYSAAPRDGYDTMRIGLDEIRDERASDFWWQLKSPTLRSLEK
jgi:sterol desaturase/sphingolipid hydroxylase (fatty acid hydroxylase superfamily)